MSETIWVCYSQDGVSSRATQEPPDYCYWTGRADIHNVECGERRLTSPEALVIETPWPEWITERIPVKDLEWAWLHSKLEPDALLAAQEKQEAESE